MVCRVHVCTNGKSSRSITNTDLLHRSKSAIMKIKTRRGHTKSRNGCVLCKSSRRKVRILEEDMSLGDADEFSVMK